MLAGKATAYNGRSLMQHHEFNMLIRIHFIVCRISLQQFLNVKIARFVLNDIANQVA